MANRSNASAPYYSYEYYLDYLDLLPVDEKELRAHKHAIVIAFWVSLAAFVVLLFLILLYMPWPGPPRARNGQHHCPCPCSLRLNLPVCVRRHLLLHRAPRGPRRPHRAQPGRQAAEHPALLPRPPPPPRPTLLSYGNRPSMGTPLASADLGHKPSWPPTGDSRATTE